MFYARCLVAVSAFLICLSSIPALANLCQTQLFSINACKYAVGSLIDINEYNENPYLNSKTQFISATLRYTNNTNDSDKFDRTQRNRTQLSMDVSYKLTSLPNRLNALPVDKAHFTDCLTPHLCQPNALPSISLSTVTGSVLEGGKLIFEVALNKPSIQDTEISVSTSPITPPHNDYYYPDQTITIAAGELSHRIVISTNDNMIYEGNKQFHLYVSAEKHATGSAVQIASIIENDPNTDEQLHLAAKTGQVDWEGSDGCCHGQRIRGIKGHFPNAPKGTVVNFYISDQIIATKTLHQDDFSYADNRNSTWWMNNHTVAWATLTLNGVTVNVHHGLKQTLHNHHNVSCANGCW